MAEVFKVTRGFVDNTMYVERLRDLTEDDFKVVSDDEPIWRQYGKHWGWTLGVDLVGQALEEAVAIWGDPEEKYHGWARKNHTPSKTCHSIDIQVRFQGCRSEEARQRKKDQGLEKIKVLVKERRDELLAQCIQEIQDAFDRLIQEANEDYERQHVRALTGDADWADLDEAAGVVPKLARIKELREELARLHREVKEARNAEALKEFEAENWTFSVKDKEGQFTVVEPVAQRIREIYEKNEAFESHGHRLL